MTSCAGKRGRKGLLPLPACAAAFTHLRRSQERAGDRAPIPPTRSGGGWLAAQAARRVGALSGNAPHPSAWLRQSATLPFAKGRDRRLTRCVHAVARAGGGWQKDTLRVSVFIPTLDAKRRALATAARRVGALSGNAPHPSAWLRQSATLPFEKGRDRRPTTCVNPWLAFAPNPTGGPCATPPGLTPPRPDRRAAPAAAASPARIARSRCWSAHRA